MRRVLLALAILVGGLANAGPLRAGVYNLDPPPGYPSDFVQAHRPEPVADAKAHVGQLLAIALEDKELDPKNPARAANSLRSIYRRQFDELEAKQNNGTLSSIDRINLGACLIRLGRFAKAREFLEESSRVVPETASSRFLLLLNLASAYQQDESLLQRAIDTQRQALRMWPAVWAGWNRWESAWYLRAEQYALTVMQLRHRELIRSQGSPSTTFQPPYALFAGVPPFAAHSGEYEAGGIDVAKWNALPQDAEMIVLQLLFWNPRDNRLTWLYAELLNARGKVDYAADILKFLVVDSRLRNRDLMEHYQILKEAKPLYLKLNQDPTLSRSILWALRPPGQLLTPGIGAAANELGWAAAFHFSGQPLVPPSSPPAPLAATRGSWLPDWRTITVSFAAGLIVALLGVLQWQQWRRRRQVAVLARQGEESAYG